MSAFTTFPLACSQAFLPRGPGDVLITSRNHRWQSVVETVQVDVFSRAESTEFLAKRVWHVARPGPDGAAFARLAELIRASRRPLIVAGGGVIYSDACDALRRFVDGTGIAVGDTQAGKGVLPFDHPQSAGAVALR